MKFRRKEIKRRDIRAPSRASVNLCCTNLYRSLLVPALRTSSFSRFAYPLDSIVWYTLPTLCVKLHTLFYFFCTQPSRSQPPNDVVVAAMKAKGTVRKAINSLALSSLTHNHYVTAKRRRYGGLKCHGCFPAKHTSALQPGPGLDVQRSSSYLSTVNYVNFGHSRPLCWHQIRYDDIFASDPNRKRCLESHIAADQVIPQDLHHRVRASVHALRRDTALCSAKLVSISTRKQNHLTLSQMTKQLQPEKLHVPHFALSHCHRDICARSDLFCLTRVLACLVDIVVAGTMASISQLRNVKK